VILINYSFNIIHSDDLLKIKMTSKENIQKDI